MNTHTIRVRLDGSVYPITLRYGHWLPRLIRFGGVHIGTTVLFRRPHPKPKRSLLGHELIHALDFVRLWNRTPFRLYWLAVAWDIARYFVAWMLAGFRYRRIPEEVVAYRDQWLVAYGSHPDIQLVDDWP